MAATDIILYNDIVNRRLVLGLNNQGAFNFSAFFQAEKINFQLYPVTPTNSAAAPFYAKASISNIVPYMYVGPRQGTTALLASQETWTPVLDAGATTGYFSASLDLNTTQMNTAIGNSDTISTLIEIQMSESGVRRITYQSALTVNATVYDISGAASLPSPATSYYTSAEQDAMFVKWLNSSTASRGKTITLYSPDGTAIRTIGVNNDKSALDDLA